MRLFAVVALPLALAGCELFGRDLSTAELCRAVDEADVRETLGASAGTVIAAEVENGACVWRFPGQDGTPRSLTASVHRESALERALPPQTGAAFFEEALRRLEEEHPRTRVLGGLGEAAVMGFGAIGEGPFAGGLVARKDGDVLVMRVEGEDPAAFEATARAMAEAM